MQTSSRSLGTLQRCLRCALVVALLGATPGLFAADTFKMPVTVNGKTYQADAVVQSDGSIKVVVAVVLVFRQDGQVQPEPKPEPKPPTPDTKANFVYVIRESRLPTPDLAFAAIDNDKGWRDVADSLKVGYRVYEQDNPVFKTMPNPLTTAKAVGLPAAVFVFPDGTSKGEKLKDKKPADLSDLIKRYGGGK